MFFPGKHVPLCDEEFRHVMIVVPVKLMGEIDEELQFFFGDNTLNTQTCVCPGWFR
jgi:hypothetical protein